MHQPDENQRANEQGDQSLPLVDALAEEFVARLRQGQRPAIGEYASRHPELAGEIEALFPTLALLEGCGAATGSGPGLPAAPPAPEQLGEYRIIREIGRGGMGIVYEAEHASMRRRVALKVMPASLSANPVHLRRFRREARAAGGLHHTNIVPVFETGHQNGVHYYAMQYIRGQSLDQVIAGMQQMTGRGNDCPGLTHGADATLPYRPDGSLAGRLLAGNDASPGEHNAEAKSLPKPVSGLADASSAKKPDSASPSLAAIDAAYFQRVAAIGLQVADALAYAHGQGILHRDIKPSNLLLDAAGIVWITDFGLARHEEDDLTQTGNIVGTLRYLAPERLNGEADVRGDLYSLGLTLYELCTHRPAFDESDRVRLLGQVTRGDPLAPRRLNRTLPRDLETIILKAIDRQPAARYQSAEELAEDLRRFMADRPLQSRRSSTPERFVRWCRRNPVIATLAGCVAGLTAVVVAGSIWFGVTAGSQARQLREQKAEIQASESEALAALFRARRAQASAARFSGRRGQCVDGLVALEQAVGMLPRLEAEGCDVEEARLALRNDAIACLANPDFRTERRWEVAEPWTTNVNFDARFERYAQAGPLGEITVRRVADESEIIRLPAPGWTAWKTVFSPDGKFLAAVYHPTREAPRQVSVWDVATGKEVLHVSGHLRHSPYAFSADSRLFLLGRSDRTVDTFELPEGRQREEPLKLEFDPLVLAIDPATEYCLVADADAGNFARVRLADGRSEVFKAASYLRSFAWTDDGRRIAAGCEDGNIYVWSRDRLTEPVQVLGGHTAAVVHLAISHRGDRLLSSSWDGSTRMWDFISGRQLVRADAVRIVGERFSPDDRRIGYASKRDEFGIWEVLDRGPLQMFSTPGKPPAHVLYPPGSPDLLLASTAGGVEFWDTESQQLLGTLPDDSGGVVKSAPDGSALFSASLSGLKRWPLRREDEAWFCTRPEALLATEIKHFALDPSGRWLVALSNEQLKLCNLTLPGRPFTDLGKHPGGNQVAISPDAQWIVSTTWHQGTGVRLWDRASGQLLMDLAPDKGAATVAFSPDGRLLAVSVWDRVSILEAGTWRKLHEIDRNRDDDWSPHLAFSSDSAVLACHYTRRSVQLLSAATGQRLAVLEAAEPGMIGHLQFNADDSQLAAVVGQGLQVWDLRRLHELLAPVGLDWEPQPRPANPAAELHSPARVIFRAADSERP